MQIAAHTSCIQFVCAVFDSQLLALSLQDYMAKFTDGRYNAERERALIELQEWCLLNPTKAQSIVNRKEINMMNMKREGNKKNDKTKKNAQLTPPVSKSSPSATGYSDVYSRG